MTQFSLNRPHWADSVIESLQNDQDKQKGQTFQIFIQHALQIIFVQHQVTLQEYL